MKKRRHWKSQRAKHFDELYGFLAQSNISAKNIKRLEILAQTPDDPHVRDHAELILEVARLYPHKRRRYVRMIRDRPSLLRKMKARLHEGWWDDLSTSGVFGDNDALERFEMGLAYRPPPSEKRNRPLQKSPPIGTPTATAAKKENSFPIAGPGLPLTVNGLKKVTVHTDGACKNNPGPGGWAAILRYGNHIKELSGAEPLTTNNRMELQAALAALRTLKHPCAVEIFTDSKYLRDGITQWLARWKANGWKTQGRASVKNQDLWEQLDFECSRHRVAWHWLKGHAGHADNEQCDNLARAEIKRLAKAGSPCPPAESRQSVVVSDG